MATPLVSRAYDIKITGYSESLKNLQDLTKAMTALDAAKRKLNGELKTKTVIGDEAAVKSLQAQIKNLDDQIQKLGATQEKTARETKLLAEARKAEADANLKAAQANRVKTQAIIDQEKELDRLIDREAKAARAAERTAKANQAEAGSYQSVLNQLRALRPFIQGRSLGSTATIDFEGATLGIAEAIQKFKELSVVEQDFRRQFAKDNLLVAEYSSGIIKAFKDLGVTDIFKKQKDDITGNLNELKRQNQELAEQYKNLATAGGAAFDKISAELKENIALQNKMEQSLENVNNALDQTGSVGNRITNSIKEGFKGAKDQLQTFVLGYIGFQAAIGGASKLVSVNFDFEDALADLKALTGVAGKDFDFLKNKALETSTATRFSAVDVLRAYKLIGSAKPELLENVEALDKMKEAAVLLANASRDTLPNSVEALTTVMNQYGFSADRAIEVTDALAAAAKFGGAEVPQIATALKDFGVQAAGSNVTIQESAALIETLGEKMIKSGEAGTALRNIFIRLNTADGGLAGEGAAALKNAGVDVQLVADNTRPLIDRLRELSKIQRDVNALNKVFGAENITAAQTLLQNVDAYETFSQQILATGVAQEQATEQTNTASVAWAKLSNQVSNFVTSSAVTSFLAGLAAALGVVVANAGVLVPLITGLAVAFGVYRAQLAVTLFLQGELQASTFSFFVLNNLRIAQQGILNGLQIAQNFIMNIYTATILRANAATGASAIVMRLLGVAVRFMLGPIGLAITLTAALVTVFGVLSSRAGETARAIGDAGKRQAEFAAAQRLNVEISERVAKATEDQAAKIRQLTAVTTDSNNTDSTRRRALNELIRISPLYRAALQGEAINIDKVRQVSDALIESLQKQARAKAISDLTAEREKRVFELETRLNATTVTDKGGVKEFLRGVGKGLFDIGEGTTRQQRNETKDALAKEKVELSELYKMIGGNKELTKTLLDANAKPVGAPAAPGGVGGSISDLQNQLADVNGQISTLDQIKNKSNVQLQQLKDLRSQRSEIQRAIREQGGTTGSAGRPYRGSRLSGETNDRFKDIDAQKNELLALAQQYYAEGKLNEEEFLNDVLQINKTAIDAKLNKLIKPANAAERIEVANLHKERIDQETETNKKLFDLYSRNAENLLRTRTREAQRDLDATALNPDASFEAKARAQQTFNLDQLEAQRAFNSTMLSLEQTYNQRSTENEIKRADTITDILKSIRAQRLAMADAELADIQKNGNDRVARFKIVTEEQKRIILDSSRSADDKKSALTVLNREENKGILSREILSLSQQIPVYKEKLALKQITEKEYVEFYAGYVAKSQELNDLLIESVTKISTVQDLASNQLSKLFGFSQGSDKDKLLGQVIGETYQFAQDAMSSYYESERGNIEASKQAVYERIDLEKQQLLNKAQSEGERTAIERQAKVARDKADKDAFEKNKKIQIAQAQINLATQLSNLAVIAFSPNPLNIATLGAAGAIMYGIQAAIALAGYAMNVRRINSAKAFARGGLVTPINNGRINNRPNIPAQSNGDNILATVRVGEVVLNEEQQRRLGGAATFRRLGVPGFASGGLVEAGASLSAPVNPRGYMTSSNPGLSGDIQNLMVMVADVTNSVNNVSEHVRTMKVQVVAGEVEETNQKIKKANSIGTL